MTKFAAAKDKNREVVTVACAPLHEDVHSIVWVERPLTHEQVSTLKTLVPGAISWERPVGLFVAWPYSGNRLDLERLESTCSVCHMLWDIFKCRVVISHRHPQCIPPELLTFSEAT
jgi:hypothetical protein